MRERWGKELFAVLNRKTGHKGPNRKLIHNLKRKAPQRVFLYSYYRIENCILHEQTTRKNFLNNL